MKLFLLVPKDLDGANSPWTLPHHDEKIFGMVIRAHDEKSARMLAQMNGGKETHPDYWTKDYPFVKVWMDEKYSHCVQIDVDGRDQEVIMKNFSRPWQTLPLHYLQRSDGSNWIPGYEPTIKGAVL
jgi:hypothetical protein